MESRKVIFRTFEAADYFCVQCRKHGWDASIDYDDPFAVVLTDVALTAIEARDIVANLLAIDGFSASENIALPTK